MYVKLTLDEIQMIVEAIEDSLSNGDASIEHHLPLRDKLFDLMDTEISDD